ncbi:MAG: hypothetical protein FJW31_08355 [Acidobacteria bacterium]|nr:hypothetical protein [Acidobacteriota bacterium]
MTAPPAAAAAALHFTATTLDFTCLTRETARKQLPAAMGCGLATLHYNRDGKPDLLLINGAGRPNRLLRNEGNRQWRVDPLAAPGGRRGRI